MENSNLANDGPGKMAFGDTVTIRGILDDTGDPGPTVTLSVFGSYVEVEFVHHKRDGDDGGLKPWVNDRKSERDLSEEQSEYVATCATLAAGLYHGWFPEETEQVLGDDQ